MDNKRAQSNEKMILELNSENKHLKNVYQEAIKETTELRIENEVLREKTRQLEAFKQKTISTNQEIAKQSKTKLNGKIVLELKEELRSTLETLERTKQTLLDLHIITSGDGYNNPSIKLIQEKIDSIEHLLSLANS